MARSDYYKVHMLGRYSLLTLCRKPVKFDAGMCGVRQHEMTNNPTKVTCGLCRNRLDAQQER